MDDAQKEPGAGFALRVRWIGLIAGPLSAVVAYSALAGAEGLSEEGRRALAMAALMAVWWLTEALPISATALVPLAAIPLLGIGGIGAAAAPYADPIIFLFLSGFLLGAAFEKCGAHKRVALACLSIVGVKPGAVVAGVMLVAAFMSFWVSNTATAVMMMPIAMSLAAMAKSGAGEAGAQAGSAWSEADARNFGVCLVLAIAYAASIGGMGTPIGSPPNAFLVKFARDELQSPVGFGPWMIIALPIIAAMLPAVWFLLTKVLHRVSARALPGGREEIFRQRAALGAVSSSEWLVFIVFALAASAWIARVPVVTALPDASALRQALERLGDAGIGMIAALALFAIPVSIKRREFALGARDLETVQWGVLVLFGGGLSLAAALARTKADAFLGAQAQHLAGLSPLLIMIGLVALVIVLSELASNTAVAAALVPIFGKAAEEMGVSPLAMLFVVTLAASLGFALPVATPPNAIAYATGCIRLPTMLRAGIVMDIVCGLILVLVLALLGPTLLEWAGLAHAAALPASAGP